MSQSTQLSFTANVKLFDQHAILLFNSFFAYLVVILIKSSFNWIREVWVFIGNTLHKMFFSA